MSLYRKKPVVIAAVVNSGEWAPVKEWLDALYGSHPGVTRNEDGTLSIVTLEGEMRCQVGDWLICGVKGELYPCKPDIFETTYEAVGAGPGTDG